MDEGFGVGWQPYVFLSWRCRMRRRVKGSQCSARLLLRSCELCASRRALAVVEMTVVVGIRSKVTMITDCLFVDIRLNARSHTLFYF